MAQAQQPPQLRDVIDIKESISTSDFVLPLSEATTPEGAERALQDYVVTERLLENFDEALGYIKTAPGTHKSKAADASSETRHKVGGRENLQVTWGFPALCTGCEAAGASNERHD